MKKMLLISLLFVACQSKTDKVSVKANDGQDGTNGTSCSVQDELSNGVKIGSRIVCADSQSVVLNGENGIDGQDGHDGTNGQNGTSVAVTSASLTTCPAGGIMVNEIPVCNGVAGSQGIQGPPGTSASSTSIVQLCNKEYGIKIGTSVYAVYHQEMCANGPCDNPANAKYSNTYLSLLTPGMRYQTTDGTECQFTVNSNGSITL